MLSTCWFHTGDAALKVLQVKAQELLDESAKGPSEARAAEMVLEYQIVGAVNETYGPTYPWAANLPSLKKKSRTSRWKASGDTSSSDGTTGPTGSGTQGGKK